MEFESVTLTADALDGVKTTAIEQTITNKSRHTIFLKTIAMDFSILLRQQSTATCTKNAGTNLNGALSLSSVRDVVRAADLSALNTVRPHR